MSDITFWWGSDLFCRKCSLINLAQIQLSRTYSLPLFYQFEVTDMLLWIAVPCFVCLYDFSYWIFKGRGQPVLLFLFNSILLPSPPSSRTLPRAVTSLWLLKHVGLWSNWLLPSATQCHQGLPFPFHLAWGLLWFSLYGRILPNYSCGVARPLPFPFGSVTEWPSETLTWQCKTGLGQHWVCSKRLSLIAPSRGTYLFFISISKTYSIGSATHSQ